MFPNYFSRLEKISFIISLNIFVKPVSLSAPSGTPITFFFKIYFIFIGKADIQRGETERKMIHSPSEHNGPMLCQSEARSLFRVSHAGAGSQSFGPSSTAFPGHRRGCRE